MRVDVVDRDVDAVDDERRLGPLARLLAPLRVVLRALIVRARVSEHDHAAVQFHVTCVTFPSSSDQRPVSTNPNASAIQSAARPTSS